jgi:uncharacterized membrane protein
MRKRSEKAEKAIERAFYRAIILMVLMIVLLPFLFGWTWKGFGVSVICSFIVGTIGFLFEAAIEDSLDF